MLWTDSQTKMDLKDNNRMDDMETENIIIL